MNEGRLIRVSKFRGDPKAVSYLVAMRGKVGAVELITRQAAIPGDEVEDLGRVTEELITAMHLGAGQFMSIGGIPKAAQQQHPKTGDKPE